MSELPPGQQEPVPEQQPEQPQQIPEAQAEQDEQERVIPHIWVGSLLDYNNGILHGAWTDPVREPEAIHHDIQDMLSRSPTARQTGEAAEEWDIFDYEGFGRLRIDQHESIEAVSQIARGVAEHGLAYAAYADVMDADPEAMPNFERDYLGHYDDLAAYAQRLVDDAGYEHTLDAAVPEHLRPYVRVDTAALGKDLFLGGAIHVVVADGGGFWIFNGE